MTEINANNKNEQIKSQPNTDEPFFAYGFFKKGELAYYKIKECVKNDPQPGTVKGLLFEKDGLPILTQQRLKVRGKNKRVNFYKIKGELLSFKDGVEAYKRINELEPGELYCWETTEVELNSNVKRTANILVARDSLLNEDKTVNGAFTLKDEGDRDYYDNGCVSWPGHNDALFTKGIEFLRVSFFEKADEYRYLKPYIREGDVVTFNRLFSLQMAYAFLWTIIDRHNTLKYYLKSKSDALKWQRKQMIRDPLFQAAINKIGDSFIFNYPVIYESSSAKSTFFSSENINSIDNWEKKLDTYYQIRCNVIHRGKAGHDSTDFPKIRGAFLDMFAIIYYMLSIEFNSDLGEDSFAEQKALYGINKLKEYKRRDEIAKAELQNSSL